MKVQVATLFGVNFSLQSFAAAHPHTHAESSNPKVLVSRQFEPENLYENWPSYDQLPLDPSYPTKAAWGVWVITPSEAIKLDSLTEILQGADDIEGALNHITNATILAATGEIKLGRAFNLK